MPQLTRRTVLEGIGSTLVLTPLLPLIGCADAPGGLTADAGALVDAGFADSGVAPDAGADGGAEGDSGEADGAEGSDAQSEDAAEPDSGVPSGWATGGTASMSGNYPDPFAGGLGLICNLSCAQTLGPCYHSTVERRDISEGQNGLPVRFAFKVVDEACAPIAGATVDIWHTSATGIYSGVDAPTGCTFDDVAARAGRWHRGVQTTDAEGRCDFDSCYPGWYSGRTIHIHFTVRVGGVTYVTSQLYFDDRLSDSIIASEPIYSARGPRNVDNTTDGIAPTAITDYSFQTQRMSDGAMLAWKALVLRGSLATPLCAV